MLRKGYNYLLFISALLFLISFLTSDKTLDIHLHDTYFVIGYSHILVALSLLLFLQWLIYFLLRKFNLLQMLTWIHVIITILFILFLAYTLTSNDRFVRFIDLSSFQRAGIRLKLSESGNYVFLVFLFAQIIWVVNIITGLIRGNRKKGFDK